MWGDRSVCQRENKTAVGSVHVIRGWARNDLLDPQSQIPQGQTEGVAQGAGRQVCDEAAPPICFSQPK